MANMCANVARFRGDLTYLTQLHRKMVDAPMRHQADGWMDVLRAEVVAVDARQAKALDFVLLPFDSHLDLKDDQLVIYYDTKWDPEVDLLAAVAATLPLTSVGLFASESGSAVIQDHEWNGKERRYFAEAEAVWDSEDGPLAFVRVSDEGESRCEWWFLGDPVPLNAAVEAFLTCDEDDMFMYGVEEFLHYLDTDDPDFDAHTLSLLSRSENEEVQEWVKRAEAVLEEPERPAA